MSTDKPVMYSSEKVERTLDDNFLTNNLRNARKNESELLQKELSDLYDFFKIPLKVFDIGIGDGYVPISFKKKLLANIETYIGIDNSTRELEHCNRNVSKVELSNKIKTFEFDATNLNDDSFRQKLPLPFHAVICTYFTPGNFRPDEIKLEEDELGHIKPYSVEALNPNKKFQKVFSEAYKLLCKNGKLILGSTYIESSATRLKQEEFYKNCGMNIITTEKDNFTATREGFWSERFTDEKVYSYLSWIPRENIRFLSLDKENFAQMIVMKKQ
jgi:SAM-dependent methyltransferase